MRMISSWSNKNLEMLDFVEGRKPEDPEPSALAELLLDGLEATDDVQVHGITDRDLMDHRVPTFSFTHARHAPGEIARRLGDRGVFVWHGNYYALPLTEALGVEPLGMVRVGLLHYNTRAEVERFLDELGRLD